MKETKQALHEYYQLQYAPKQCEVKDFYDLRLFKDIHEEMNGV